MSFAESGPVRLTATASQPLIVEFVVPLVRGVCAEVPLIGSEVLAVPLGLCSGSLELLEAMPTQHTHRHFRREKHLVDGGRGDRVVQRHAFQCLSRASTSGYRPVIRISF